MSKVIGIDLGTTNSVMAVMESGMPMVIPNAEGNRLTPSVVAIGKNGERLVGKVARRQAITNPEGTVFSIKRFMGCKFADSTVQHDQQLMPYRLTPAPNGDVWVSMNGRTYPPPEISAMILQKLKRDAEVYLGQPITQAVISVPAYFNDSQRQATKEAGRIAGLEVLRIINEPTASALAYDFPPERRETIAVYDLGGGTFDISILDLGAGVFEVLATNGDTHLGGDDFDRRIVDWLCNEFEREHGIDLRKDRLALQRVKEAAEQAKIELSTRVQTEINLPFIAHGPRGPRHLNMSLTRAQLEQLVGDLIERTVEPCRQAMADAELKTTDIDEVILVGGQTRMPAVREKVKGIFGKLLVTELNPEEAVGLGAGIQAGALVGDVKNVLLIDVTPLTLSIETRGGVASPIIRRNTTIPVRKSQLFTTAKDDQTSVEIVVVQGERAMAVENTVLGRFSLDGIPPAPRGEPKIEVTFKIDADGILQVTAQDQATGREQQITVTANSGLSEEEIERMVAEAREHEARDQQRRREIEALNRADRTAYQAEKTLERYGDRLTPAPQSKVRSEVAALRQALRAGDIEKVEQAMRELDETTRMIARGFSVKRSIEDVVGASEKPILSHRKESAKIL
jgi:molecular chaperone DnaK